MERQEQNTIDLDAANAAHQKEIDSISGKAVDVFMEHMGYRKKSFKKLSPEAQSAIATSKKDWWGKPMINRGTGEVIEDKKIVFFEKDDGSALYTIHMRGAVSRLTKNADGTGYILQKINHDLGTFEFKNVIGRMETNDINSAERTKDPTIIQIPDTRHEIVDRTRELADEVIGLA